MDGIKTTTRMKVIMLILTYCGLITAGVELIKLVKLPLFKKQNVIQDDDLNKGLFQKYSKIEECKNACPFHCMQIVDYVTSSNSVKAKVGYMCYDSVKSNGILYQSHLNVMFVVLIILITILSTIITFLHISIKKSDIRKSRKTEIMLI